MTVYNAFLLRYARCMVVISALLCLYGSVSNAMDVPLESTIVQVATSDEKIISVPKETALKFPLLKKKLANITDKTPVELTFSYSIVNKLFSWTDACSSVFEPQRVYKKDDCLTPLLQQESVKDLLDIYALTDSLVVDKTHQFRKALQKHLWYKIFWLDASQKAALLKSKNIPIQQRCILEANKKATMNVEYAMNNQDQFIEVNCYILQLSRMIRDFIAAQENNFSCSFSIIPQEYYPIVSIVFKLLQNVYDQFKENPVVDVTPRTSIKNFELVQEKDQYILPDNFYKDTISDDILSRDASVEDFILIFNCFNYLNISLPENYKGDFDDIWTDEKRDAFNLYFIALKMCLLNKIIDYVLSNEREKKSKIDVIKRDLHDYKNVIKELVKYINSDDRKVFLEQEFLKTPSSLQNVLFQVKQKAYEYRKHLALGAAAVLSSFALYKWFLHKD